MTLTLRNLLCLVLTALGAMAAQAAAPDFDGELAGIQQAWAVANYQTPDEAARKRAFEALVERAHAFSTANPQRAEAFIWEGIVLSTYAGVKGGLGALGLAKRSRAALEQAMKLDANALEGSAYTSLGALYSKVPGFPVGFGSDKKARELLQEAVKINPNGIDSNYFYGDFLIEQKEYAQARNYLQKALQAAPRPGREIADQGRREEINTLLTRISGKS